MSTPASAARTAPRTTAWWAGLRHRDLLVAAGALAVLSLAFPWRNSSLEFGLASAWVPGYCHISYDGYSYCDPGVMAFGTSTTVAGPVAGFALSIRVIAVLAAALLWWAWRSRSRRAAVAGISVAIFGLAVDGLVLTSGRVLWMLALVVVITAFRRTGLPSPTRGATGLPGAR